MIALKTLIFTVVVPGTVAFLIPGFLVPGRWVEAFVAPSAWLVGLVPVALGACLYVWCAGAFTVIGQGTPAPIDAPRFLVRAGPYRWVRNPMYVGVLAMILGQAIIFHSWLLVSYALLVWLAVHLFVVFVEEPALRQQFGESYEAYLRTVPRWPHPVFQR